MYIVQGATIAMQFGGGGNSIVVPCKFRTIAIFLAPLVLKMDFIPVLPLTNLIFIQTRYKDKYIKVFWDNF